MNPRTIELIHTPAPQPGSGILRPFPSPQIPDLDPFVFLDTGAPVQLGDAEIYVGPHSHRGVQPVSLVFRARIEHRDSLGNHRTVESGGMQWLVAGSGALHEEVLRGDDGGVFHMAQLWVNLPAEQKMVPPAHFAIAPDDVPSFSDVGVGASVRLFAGDLAGRHGPAPLGTPVLIAHVELAPGGFLNVPVPSGWRAATTVVAGSADGSAHGDLGVGATAVYADDGDGVTLSSVQGGQLLVMAGRPIGEPIAMGGGFVMNSKVEITHAFADEAAGRFGVLEASR